MKYEYEEIARYHKLYPEADSYTVFDHQGLYIGWACKKGGPLESSCTDILEDRVLPLANVGQSVTLFINGFRTAEVDQICFRSDGRLQCFRTVSGSYYPIFPFMAVTLRIKGTIYFFQDQRLFSAKKL